MTGQRGLLLDVFIVLGLDDRPWEAADFFLLAFASNGLDELFSTVLVRGEFFIFRIGFFRVGKIGLLLSFCDNFAL